jgi:hypothetical protein
VSRGLSFVELQQSAEPLAPADAATVRRRSGQWQRDHIAQTLVVTLRVVVLDELGDGPAQMALAERHDVAEAFLL